MNYKIKFEKRKFYKANSITLLNSYGLNLFTVLHVQRNEWSTDKSFEMSLQFYRGISQFRSGTLHKIKYCYADISQQYVGHNLHTRQIYNFFMMCRLDQQPYKLHYTVKPGLSSYPQGMAGPQLNTGFSRIGVKRNKECHFVLTVLRRKIIYGALRTFALQMLTLNLGGKRGLNLT